MTKSPPSRSRKAKLFNYVASIDRPDSKPQKTIEQLKKEADAIRGDDAQKYDLLPTIEPKALYIEGNELFTKTIVGNKDSTVAELIKNLDNSDWVKAGLRYISDNEEKQAGLCPFCQNQTITQSLRDNIRAYFDESYEKDIDELRNLWKQYHAIIEEIPKREKYQDNPFIIENKQEFENLYNALLNSLTNNKRNIESKLESPSQSIRLSDSSQLIVEFNAFIIRINEAITLNNTKLNDKRGALKIIKDEFWEIMRWEYDQTISSFASDQKSIQQKIKDIKDQDVQINTRIEKQNQIIVNQRKNTINIEVAREKINNGLQELGIDEFRVEKYTDSQYKIGRNEQCANTFSSLSEGEKMIISFLYFRELCKGTPKETRHLGKRIVVIDDPISSLSHIFIFNIGQMIKNDFFNSQDFDQVLLLTHSLYFFYEMTISNHDKREECQKLFRLSKNNTGSYLSKMKYEDIQNDYHAYWSIVKDENQNPALIANCMRNIIEYFFGFIEKKDLNKVFQKPSLQKAQHQAFCRYMNRESHSIGQNVYDYKEFNYDEFREAFRLVFVECHYEAHYERMMK